MSQSLKSVPLNPALKNLPKKLFLLLLIWLGYLVTLMLTGPVTQIFGGAHLSAPAEWSSVLGVTFIEAATLFAVANQINLPSRALFWVLFMFFHGVKTFLMMLELYVYLNLWVPTPLVTGAQVLALELHGIICAAAVCGAVVWAKSKLTKNEMSAAVASNHSENVFLSPSVWRLLSVGVVYLVCYFLAGAFILMPLAGNSFDPTYGGLKVPAWMPLFQVARGIMFAYLILMLMRALPFTRVKSFFAVAIILVIISTTQLWLPNPYMQSGLRWAHWIEMVISMAVFGFLASWMLSSRKKQNVNLSASKAQI